MKPLFWSGVFAAGTLLMSTAAGLKKAGASSRVRMPLRTPPNL